MATWKEGPLGFGLKTLAVVVIIVALAIASSFNIYLNLEGSSAVALWNDKEAYFFIGTRSIGHRVNVLRYPWFLVRSYLGGVEDPDDDRGILDAIQVTPSALEHHVLKRDYRNPGNYADMFTPLEGRIYANDPSLGGLCRWAGDRFEPATPDEQKRLDGINQLTNRDIDHAENGWSKHSFAVGAGGINDTFTIDVCNTFRIALSDTGTVAGGRVFSINLLRPNHPPENIWMRELHWGTVTKADYQRVFRSHS